MRCNAMRCDAPVLLKARSGRVWCTLFPFVAAVILQQPKKKAIPPRRSTAHRIIHLRSKRPQRKKARKGREKERKHREGLAEFLLGAQVVALSMLRVCACFFPLLASFLFSFLHRKPLAGAPSRHGDMARTLQSGLLLTALDRS
ncbi:hypothetical protein TWF696_007129 [Orbilia brochopaga]|uniref:Transmembrane protein n=1 Tax=Orbilia brochopaga TaxID=3140254 RepID=A0AAV9UUA1_9PEZI